MFTTIHDYIWGDIEDNDKMWEEEDKDKHRGHEDKDNVREHEGEWVMVDNDIHPKTSSLLHENTQTPFQKLQSSLSICYTPQLSICYNKDISLPSPLPICYTPPLHICYKDNISTNKFIPCKSALSPAFTSSIIPSDTTIVRVKYEPRREATSPTFILGSMPVTTFLSLPKKYRNKLQRRKTSVMGKPISKYAIANIKMYYTNFKLCV